MSVNNKNGGEILDQRLQGFVERMGEVGWISWIKTSRFSKFPNKLAHEAMRSNLSFPWDTLQAARP